MNKMQDEIKLKPNDKLGICIVSSSAAVEIVTVNSMVSLQSVMHVVLSLSILLSALLSIQIVKGKHSLDRPVELKAMTDGSPSIPAITSFRFVNRTSFVLSPRIPVNYFNFQADSAFINVEGSLTMDLKRGANPANSNLLMLSPRIANFNLMMQLKTKPHLEFLST